MTRLVALGALARSVTTLVAAFVPMVGLARFDAAGEGRPRDVRAHVASCPLEPIGDAAPPVGFPPPPPPAHRATPLGRALGRRLFFDARLSRNGAVSCASCHEPAHAFSVPDALPARGVSGKPLARHAPALVNLAWADTGLFWDGGAKNLESQALAPLLHEDEMGRAEDLERLLADLGQDPTYRRCFAAVYGEGGLTIGHVLQAIAQFERSLVSADTRWDRKQRGEGRFSKEEAAGEAVFSAHCASCHAPPLFTDRGFHNNGLDGAFPASGASEQRGRARITLRAEDAGKYKTPTLRNVSRSAPYMHDGRIATLAGVIDHYRHRVVASATLDVRLRAGPARPRIAMSDAEASALECFLHTLSDQSAAGGRTVP